MKRQRSGLYGTVGLIAMPLLAGCSAFQTADPLAEADASALPAACVQPLDDVDRLTWMRAATAVFEAQGYAVRDTETRLGLLSAERVRAMPGLGATYQGQLSSMWGGGIAFQQRRAFDSLADPWWVFRSDPVRIERASVVADQHRLVATRGETVSAPDGYAMDARPASTAVFCSEFFAALRTRLAPGHGQEVR